MIDLEDGCWLCDADGKTTSKDDILFRMKFMSIERWVCLGCLLNYLISHFLQYVDMNKILSDKLQRV